MAPRQNIDLYVCFLFLSALVLLCPQDTGGAVRVGPLMHIIWAHTDTHTSTPRRSCHKEASQAEMRGDVTYVGFFFSFLAKGEAAPTARSVSTNSVFKTLVSGVRYQPEQIHCGHDGHLILQKVCCYCLSDSVVVSVFLEMGPNGPEWSFDMVRYQCVLLLWAETRLEAVSECCLGCHTTVSTSTHVIFLYLHVFCYSCNNKFSFFEGC